MRLSILNCGYLKVQATEMIKPLDREQINIKYKVDLEGYMKLSMNALLIEGGGRMILIDPGAADFLPGRLVREYGLEIPVSLEEMLGRLEILPDQITDVIFTHLHFDHASGAFRRVPGNIVKRFPNARYHVLKVHYQYALDPDPFEEDSFCTGLLKYLDRIFWLEDWDLDWIDFKVFNGHTRSMVVPLIHTKERLSCFMSDLVPLEILSDPELWCGYDLDSELLRKEKQEFLKGLKAHTELYLFHDTLKENIFH